MAYREFTDGGLSRRGLLRGGACLAGGSMLASLPFGSALFAHDVSEAWPSVAAEVERYVKERKVANMIATFGWKQDDHAHSIARGTLALSGNSPANMDSLYRIYSMTKPITGMMAMQLISEGKLGLDQPLSDILPAFADMQVQKEYDGPISEDNLEPATTPITIRHLLTHTAGLGYQIIQQGAIKDEYDRLGLIPGQVSRMPIPGAGSAKPVASLEAFADALATVPLVYQPGTKWSYSVGLDLMGRVIEVVEGKPFDAVLQERIFGPAGMASTFFTVPKSEIGRFTTNYWVMGDRSLPIDPAASSIYLDTPPFPFGGAGLVSSPKDYDRFLRMLLGKGMIDGTRVLSEQAVNVGTSNLLPATVDTTGSWAEGQGFGAGGRVVGRSYGWGGAAGTVAVVDFEHGLRAQLYSQYMPTDVYEIQSAFPDLVRADLAKAHG
ncbi:serine hydrolase domain-containing protein [Alteriqipengyuania lutimaris]|uniref:Class A beta-lactamase-related serine hydrolase n=1 Tax=Alteriqipengyuania lutimaris TaxID=1538146 RepID=A0A395LHD7_9SPHN|nr:serine hydrolase domain-containing protein [Alteriqipengyuania lutimaris]MBB3035483.1 CubicO group peptidase (beta-lactamase class C family) [Alteriqipengyuania lutimaris]RDS76049.1 class A beta-lactamase-related serine hydrolase [Alteriqipengyuania lutimaris]